MRSFSLKVDTHFLEWRFVESGTRIDANDVDELLSLNAEIIIQKTNPKRKPSKSHDLFEQYKFANNVKEMLSLGGRRGDVSYDIAHGWIKFKDPDLERRFGRPGLGDSKDAEDDLLLNFQDEEDDEPLVDYAATTNDTAKKTYLQYK